MATSSALSAAEGGSPTLRSGRAAAGSCHPPPWGKPFVLALQDLGMPSLRKALQVEARTPLLSNASEVQHAMHLLQDLGDLSLWEAMQVGGQDDPTSADFDTAAALSGLELDPPGGAQLPRSMSSDLDEVQGQSRFRDFRQDMAELKPSKPARKSERSQGWLRRGIAAAAPAVLLHRLPAGVWHVCTMNLLEPAASAGRLQRATCCGAARMWAEYFLGAAGQCAACWHCWGLQSKAFCPWCCGVSAAAPPPRAVCVAGTPPPCRPAGKLGRSKAAPPPAPPLPPVAHSQYLIPPDQRKGRGGRQPALDPRLDPSVDPKRAKRILANRLSAARSKMKQKTHMEVGAEWALWVLCCTLQAAVMAKCSSCDRQLSHPWTNLVCSRR